MKLGRLPRKYDQRVPHYSSLRLAAKQVKLPDSNDWSAKMPADLGMMLNDQVGDCVIAYCYHAIQVWSFNATGKMLTNADQYVGQAYTEITGWNPDDPTTDNGTNVQDALTYWVQTGLPVDPTLVPGGRHKLLAFVELDPRNVHDVSLAAYETGNVCDGWDVPAYIMANAPNIPLLWDLDPDGDNSVDGGHCTGAPGFATSAGRINQISWGSHAYEMTDRFWLSQVDEAYALVDGLWLTQTNATPLGLTVAQLEAAMQAIAAA